MDQFSSLYYFFIQAFSFQLSGAFSYNRYDHGFTVFLAMSFFGISLFIIACCIVWSSVCCDSEDDKRRRENYRNQRRQIAIRDEEEAMIETEIDFPRQRKEAITTIHQGESQ
ncbi:hypothetical protein PMAYCL1PPCAC_06210 [Pristionchus mayeri]|uniref:Uncharacterized protein n=1 Tax=Pristionchus mayeri TaxID=1317129 RepID=A0AAN4ZFH8_9BILA|nr:hypothetical protein PMAYCL1PPCAC_06210 [Pristionchus mayeri]